MKILVTKIKRTEAAFEGEEKTDHEASYLLLLADPSMHRIEITKLSTGLQFCCK